MSPRFGLAILATALLLHPNARAMAQETAPPAPAPLFSSHVPLEITIVADFQQLGRDRGEDSPDRPTTLTVREISGDSASWNMSVHTRGNFRLRRSTCEFPPLMLDFPRSRTGGTVFEGQNKLKLVTHCDSRRDRYEQNTIVEYLLYRVYNLLTEYSFRVRLARMHYVDIATPQDTLTRMGFLIEDDEAMAARNNATIDDTSEVHQEHMHYDFMTIFSLFQYMIGNTDWSVSARHNVVVIVPEHGIPIAVPYDLDWSGAVDAPYAVPHDRLGTRSVTERVFISGCRTRQEMRFVFERLQERREEIHDLFRNQLELEEGTRRRVLSYFDRFYRTIENENAVGAELVRGCPEGP